VIAAEQAAAELSVEIVHFVMAITSAEVLFWHARERCGRRLTAYRRTS